MPAYRKAVFGLGNPGLQYHWTRHNLGFLVIDHYLANFGKGSKLISTKFSRTSKVGSFLSAKPETFMNRSGVAVAELCVTYNIQPQDILVIYDDYALPFGTLRVRKLGGAGGHNGMRSIIDILGTEEFPRLRLGIGDGTARSELADYVLQPFSKEQEKELDDFLDQAAEAIDCFLKNDVDTAMNRFNG
ncbi:aminoacyl-tRNA hydrolase [Candidatus Acetothermia bacterium]|nr:aminoacyl-tRNA hydrolase [Candidatus Acetothermia bacterium]MBI3643260.1 aminoacyl-tRNA hydrolase [Candidatus Acetothermia bacterium]